MQWVRKVVNHIVWRYSSYLLTVVYNVSVLCSLTLVVNCTSATHSRSCLICFKTCVNLCFVFLLSIQLVMSAVSVVSIDSSSHHSFSSSHMMDTTTSVASSSSSSSSSCNQDCSGSVCAEYPGAISSQSSMTSSLSEHSISSGSHPSTTISHRRFHRRKLKLDIKSAQALRRSPNHQLDLLLPNINSNTSSSAPSSSSIVTINELNYSQGLRPIENQITNPNFIRSRKTVSF